MEQVLEAVCRPHYFLFLRSRPGQGVRGGHGVGAGERAGDSHVDLSYQSYIFVMNYYTFEVMHIPEQAEALIFNYLPILLLIVRLMTNLDSIL